MAKQDLKTLKERFTDGKEPTGSDFGDAFDSFYHKDSKFGDIDSILGLREEINTRAPQTEVDELEKEVDTKASKGQVQNIESQLPGFATKDDLQSISAGMRPMGSVESLAELKAIQTPNDNDSYYVNETVNEDGDPYIWRFDKNIGINGDWVNTKQVVYLNGASKQDIDINNIANVENIKEGYVKITINYKAGHTYYLPLPFTIDNKVQIKETVISGSPIRVFRGRRVSGDMGGILNIPTNIVEDWFRVEIVQQYSEQNIYFGNNSEDGTYILEIKTIAIEEKVNNVDALISSSFTKTKQLSDNYNQFAKGRYMANGNISESNNWLRTKLQRLRSMKEQTLSGFSPQSMSNRVFLYDRDKRFVDSFNANADTPTQVTFTPPPNAFYWGAIIESDPNGVNIEINKYLETLMLNEGSVASPYEPFYLPKDQADVYKTPCKVYISPKGSDNNDGLTISTALATFTKANEILRGGGDVILDNGDYYDMDIDLSNFDSITTFRGRARLIYGYRITSATLVDGYERVYKAHIGGGVVTADSETKPSFLWQHDIPDSETHIIEEERHTLHNGREYRVPHRRVYQANSIEQIEDEKDVLMFYRNPDNIYEIYFSISDGYDLSKHPIVAPYKRISATQENNISLSNIEFLYCTLQLKNLQGVISNIVVGASNEAGCFRYDDCDNLTLRNCEAYGCRNDGFNGHTTDKTTSRVRLEDCYGHDNGDDGESSHEYFNTIHIGGLYEYNGSGIVGASGAHVMCNNVICRNNGGHRWTMNYGGKQLGFSAQGSSLDGGIGTNIYCIGCLSEGHNIGFRGIDNASKFINCISKNDKIAFGVGEKLNTIELE